MSERILNVKMGATLEADLALAARMMEALDRGETPAPYCGFGFSDVGQFRAVFTPRRWNLRGALREKGRHGTGGVFGRIGAGPTSASRSLGLTLDYL